MVIFNLIMISTSFISLIVARSIYVCVDPFRQLEIFPRILDLILYENIFSVTFSIFLVLLLVWTGLYSAFNIDAMEEGFVRKKDKSIWEKYKYKIIHSVKLDIIRSFCLYYYLYILCKSRFLMFEEEETWTL
jgi:hypothetical protein